VLDVERMKVKRNEIMVTDLEGWNEEIEKLRNSLNHVIFINLYLS